MLTYGTLILTLITLAQAAVPPNKTSESPSKSTELTKPESVQPGCVAYYLSGGKPSTDKPKTGSEANEKTKTGHGESDEKPKPGEESSGGHHRFKREESTHDETPKPADEKPKPGDEKTKPTGEKTKSTGEKIKPTDEKIKPTDLKTKPTDEKTKPTDEKTKPTDEKTKPTDEKTKPTDEKIKPTDLKSKPTSPIKSSSLPEKFTNTIPLDWISSGTGICGKYDSDEVLGACLFSGLDKTGADPSKSGWLSGSLPTLCGQEIKITKPGRATPLVVKVVDGCGFDAKQYSTGCNQIWLTKKAFDELNKTAGAEDTEKISNLTWEFKDPSKVTAQPK